MSDMPYVDARSTEAPRHFRSEYANPPSVYRRGSLGEADPGAVEHALRRGSDRITRISETTRDGVRNRISEAIEQKMSAREASEYVREWSGFDEYRAERIARTEMMFAYNSSALATYKDYGVQQVVADDGDKDEQCAARHGRVYTVIEADGIQDHPNGTLDWLPVAPDVGATRVQLELNEVAPIPEAWNRIGNVAPSPIAKVKRAVAKVANKYHDYTVAPRGKPLSNAEARRKLNNVGRSQTGDGPGGEMLKDGVAGLERHEVRRAQELVRQWNGSSRTPGGTAVKQAAAEKRGYKLNPFEQVDADSARGSYNAGWDEMVKDARVALDYNERKLVEMGLDPDETITIWRGIGNADSFGLKDAAGFQRLISTGDSFVWDTPGSAGSWTLDKDIARSFARSQKDSYSGRNGYVLEYQVRVGDIAGLPSTNGIGTYYESEVVPYGGTARKVKVLSVYN